MSSYVHPDKNKRDALILGKDPTDVLHWLQNLGILSILVNNKRKLCLKLYYNECNSCNSKQKI